MPSSLIKVVFDPAIMWISNPQPLIPSSHFPFFLFMIFWACFAHSCMLPWRIAPGWWELSHENAKAENLSPHLCLINFIRGLRGLQKSSSLASGQDNLCSTFLAPEIPLGIRLKLGFSCNLLCLVLSPTYPAFPHFLTCFCWEHSHLKIFAHNSHLRLWFLVKHIETLEIISLL